MRVNSRLNILARAIAAAFALPGAAFAASITADGTTCTLANAILSANADAPIGGCTAGSGRDTILVSATQFVGAQSLPTIVSDMDIETGGMAQALILGDNSHRLFTVGDETHAPDVTFTLVVIAGGTAHGGNASNGAGGGAGLGGALFIYDGTVSIGASTFSENGATGGSAAGFVVAHSGGGGGGGMFGVGGLAATNFQTTGGSGGGGGEFGGGGGGNTNTSELGGGNGGSGGGTNPGSFGTISLTPPTAGGFGGGGGGGAAPGNMAPSQPGASGGFGGGGGGGGGSGSSSNIDAPGPGGNGGFGGGGGAGGSASAAQGAGGSLGGFGGGAGSPGTGTSTGPEGQGGFGAGDSFEGGGGGGAGFGGAIFIRSGHLQVTDSQIAANSAQHGTGPGGNNGLAKAAGIFALDRLANGNGNDQGMPATLPVVSGCAVTFAFNNAQDAGTSNRDNADVYGADRLGLTLACGDRIFAGDFDSP